jgi:hypothetical protein
MTGKDRFSVERFCSNVGVPSGVFWKAGYSGLYALTIFDLDEHALAVDMFGFKMNDFACPQAGGIGRLQHEPVF